MEILCNIIFLDRYGIFLGLRYRWNTNIYGGPMELSSLQEGLRSIGDGTLELPNPGRETKLQDYDYHWVSLCMQHKWRQQCMDTTVHLYEGPTIQDRPESSETVYHGPDCFY